MFSFVQFSEKLSLLLRKRGLSHRALAEQLGLSNASVSAWAKGARPRPSVSTQLADYFGVTVEGLLDDSRDLPGAEPPPQKLEEVQMPYDFLAKPLKTAAALAQREHGPDPAAGQATFERHLANLRAMRELAQSQNPRDPAAASAQLDTLLAAYIAALETRT